MRDKTGPTLKETVKVLGSRGVALVRVSVDLVPEVEVFDKEGNRLTAMLTYMEDGTAQIIITRHNKESEA